MENASKALIIAGAILLSILIIALGVFIFNQAKSSVGNVGLTDQEVSAFNSKWEAYEGTQIGSAVRELVKQVNNYNRTANDGRYITIGGQGKGATVFPSTAPAIVAPTGYNAGNSYTVHCTYTTGGLVAGIEIY